MKVKPVRSVALVRPQQVDDKSAGGLYLPENTRNRMQYAVDRGELIDHGEGFWKDRFGPKPKVGDVVIYDKYKGTLITLENDGKREDLRLLQDDEIIAILEE